MVCPSLRVALLFLAPLLPAQDAQDPRKVGPHYAVTAHGGTEVMAEQALAAAERAWPIVAASFGVPTAPAPTAPLEVHLYRTTQGYEAADQKLTGGRFQRNLAMSHHESRSAHVAVQPPCSDETLRAVGLPGLTVEMVAWEAAHLARFALCPNAADHPAWFCDGLAATTARSVHDAVHPCGGPDQVPTASTAILRVQRLLSQKKLPPIASVLADRIDELDLGDRYSLRFTFFRFLQSDAQKGKLAKIAAAVRGTGGGKGFRETIAAAATAALGGTVDRDFAGFVAKQQPKWLEVYRSLTPTGRQWHQFAFVERNAVAWFQDPVKGGRLVASGSLRILPGGRQQMNFLFGRNDQDEFYSISFVADQGFVVWRFEKESMDFREIGRADAPALRLGVATPFVVDAADTALTVEVGKQNWKFTLPVALGKEVQWGLGAQAGRENGSEGSGGFWGEMVVRGKR